MEKAYLIFSISVQILLFIYILILVIELSVKFYQKVKEAIQFKKDKDYFVMQKILKKCIYLKNDSNWFQEEDSLEDLKQLINQRINAIKGN